MLMEAKNFELYSEWHAVWQHCAVLFYVCLPSVESIVPG
jgi:hypothetical protein